MDNLNAPWRIDYILAPKQPSPDGQSIFSEIANSSDDEANLVLARGETCYIVLNAYPYNCGHAMVIPYRQVADLTDRLTTGLRVRDPDDVAFCERVAWLVRQGRLPAGLVDSTYTWAIQRGRKHPFPAFEHVIRLQAAKLGVPL